MSALFETEILPDGGKIRVARFVAEAAELIDETATRAMNHMDPDTKLIHARLTEWARLVRRWAGAQGYPAESYYHKWALLKIAPHPGHDPELPGRVANVDAAVARLGAIDRSVIVRNYLEWRPANLHIGLAGVRNRRNFDIVLKRARWRVDGYLSAIEAICVESVFKGR